MSSRDGKRMAIYGRSGSGKSYYAKKLIQEIDRIICFDPEEEYGELKGFIAIEGGTVDQRMEDLREYLVDNDDTTFKIAYVPGFGTEEYELSRVSIGIAAMQLRYKNEKNDRKITILVDELNLSFPLNTKPQNDGFARLCSAGRKRGVNIIGVTQRPAEVATRFRGNIDRLACFSLSLPSDVDVIAKTVGPEAVKAVKELPEYGHIFFENGVLASKPPT